MAKKRRKPGDKKPLPSIPDRRAVEGMMWGNDWAKPGTPLAQAQEIVGQAFNEPDERIKLQLARKALETCPECADAIVLLAEHARRKKEALRLYQQAVAAGEKIIGDKFKAAAGHFWGILETRPYMRARLGLAHAHWNVGEREEAIPHLREMLTLNPDDNQGVRYTLAAFLLSLDHDEELAALLGQFPDEDSATWAYTKALLAFRRSGDSPDTRQLLVTAKKTNKHVPVYFLQKKPLPAEQPPFYSPGDENEALIYLSGFLSGWKSTPGAISWLRKNEPQKIKPTAAAKGPLSLIKQWLKKNLPQEEDVWQSVAGQFANWMTVADERVRLWVTLVISTTTELVLAHGFSEEEPGSAQLWDTLVQAMQNPAKGPPHRPAELQVRGNERWESLKPHLDEIGIRLVETEQLDQLDAVFADLSQHMTGPRYPGLLDAPGVQTEQVARFFEAAAYYYRQAPWKKVADDMAVKVECDQFKSGPWYAVPMGQSGITMGLAVYEDLAELRAMWHDEAPGHQAARRSVATTVTFDDETDMPVADFEACKRYGWTIAGPEAYPHVFHKDIGLSLRPPLAWELELMEGCLRAVPEFVNKHRQDSAAKETITVGKLSLALSWVDEK